MTEPLLDREMGEPQLLSELVPEVIHGKVSSLFYVELLGLMSVALGSWWALASLVGATDSTPTASAVIEGAGILIVISVAMGLIAAKLLPRAGSIGLSRDGVFLRVETGRKPSVLIRRDWARHAQWFRPWKDVRLVGSFVIIGDGRIFSPRWFLLNSPQTFRIREAMTNMQDRTT